jgi:hypothetical protein
MMGRVSAPNEFRSTMRSGRSDSPVLAEKPKRTGRKARGVGDIKVARSESRSSNQRGSDRHRLNDEQAVVQRKGKRHVVELINLSHGGAMVAGDFKARLWDKVALVLGESGEIECAVRWIRDCRYGLEFAHETQVDCDSETLDELLRQVIRNSFPGVEIKARPVMEEPKKLQDKRGKTRHPLIWNAIVHHDYEWDVVRLRNISTSGALIECPANLPAGVTVYLELGDAGKLAATVNWSRGNQAGLSFHEPFDVPSLSKLKPDVAAEQAAQPHFAPYGRECEQSPWAPQWGRLSVDELGKKLGG